ncbi:hypothetical protein ACLESD_52010 [Pyxidicoccus sp. 3LFB2]
MDVRPTSRAARSVVVDLPPPDTCVRLLRDPFQHARSAPPVATPQVGPPPLRAFSFSADGRRLLLYREDGSVAAMAIPHTIRATVPRARRVLPLPGHKVLGAGWRPNGGILVLSETETDYVLHGNLRSTRNRDTDPHLFRMEAEAARPTPTPAGLPPGRLLSYEDAYGNERLLLAGLDQSLFLIEQEVPSRRIAVSRVARNITAVAEVDRKVVYVARPMLSGEQQPSGAWQGVVEKDRLRHVPLGMDAEAAYFGYAGVPGDDVAGLLAVQREPGLWHLFLSGGGPDMRVPSGMQVVGMGTCREAAGRPGLLALDGDRRTFWLLTPDHRYKVAVARDDVLYAEASHALPVLGWVVKGGGLVLSNLLEGGILYQSLPGEGG